MQIFGNNDFGGIGSEARFGAIGNEEIIGRLHDILVGVDPAEAALMRALAVSGEGNGANTGDVLSALMNGGDIGSAGNLPEAIKMALARKIDPNAIQVKDRGYRDRRRFPLGFNPLTLQDGATGVTTADPQDLFRAERLIVPSDIAFGFSIVDVKVGTESQLVSQGEIPAACFTEVAVDAYLHFRTAMVGNTVSLTVRNISGGEATFRGALIGTAAR